MSKIKKAINVLREVAEKFEQTLSNVYWIDNDGGCEYCSDCIDAAKRLHRHRAPKHERRNINIERSCGGYESEKFNNCDLCGDALLVSIIPSKQYFEYAIEDFSDSAVSDRMVWEAHQLLCADEDASSFPDLAERLADLVIKNYKQDYEQANNGHFHSLHGD